MRSRAANVTKRSRLLARFACVAGTLLCAAARADHVVIAPVAAEVAARPERLQNADFENNANGAAPPWYGWMQGYEVLEEGGRNHSRGVRCAPANNETQHGASQLVTLNQKQARPIVVTGWSRAEQVDGTADNGYSIYLDVNFRDGDHLWGQTACFSIGTHDWEQRRLVLAPEKPVASLTVHALFRGHNGAVSFDDFSLVEMGDDAAIFENVLVSAFRPPAPSGSFVSVGDANGLQLKIDQKTGAPAALELSQTQLGAGGLPVFVRDVGAASPFVSPAPGAWRVTTEEGRVALEGECTSLHGLSLKLQAVARDGAIEIACEVIDTGGADRAVTAYVPFPLSGAWMWAQDMRREKPAQGLCINSFRTGAGATGARSSYPLVALSGERGGLALAVPLDEPRHHRLAYDADHGLLYAAFDLGLSPETQRAPGRATFRVLLYPFDPKWRFRAALERYYRLFPAAFEKRVPREGLWMAFTDISTLPNHEDFGFAYQEGAPNAAWDEQHGILSFPYTEPMTTWFKLPPETPRTYDGAMAHLNSLIEKQDDPLHASASAVRVSSVHDGDGRSILSVVNAPWCDGCVFALNADPSLPVTGVDPVNRGQAELRRLEKAEGDGSYIDSYEFWANSIDYNRAHFTNLDFPLIFDTQSHRLGILTAFSTFAFQRELAKAMHAQDKLMMANGALASYDFCAACLDVLGTETNWMPGGTWQPMTDPELCFRRALSFQKPYCFLMNTRYADFSLDLTERYMQRALAYGMFPGFFSENASTDCYFANPKYYEPARPLFRKYVPLIQRLAKAGWQPITHAVSSVPEVYVERFGQPGTSEVFFTVLNDSTQDRTADIRVDLTALGMNGREVGARELITDRGLAWSDSARLTLELKPEQAALLRLAAPEP